MTMPLPRLSEEQIKLLNKHIAESNLDAGQWLNQVLGFIFNEECSKHTVKQTHEKSAAHE